MIRAKPGNRADVMRERGAYLARPAPPRLAPRPWTPARAGAGVGPGGAGRRVVIVSGDIGGGHDAAADELAARLAARGVPVDRLNFLSMLSRPVHALVRESYRTMLRWAPWSYQALFAATGESASSVRLIRGALRPAWSRVRRRLPSDTGVVVTTFPFANQLFGPLRRRGGLAAPVVTYVTDFVAHPIWRCPGVDVYCVVHERVLGRDPAAGAGDVRVVRPLISDRFGVGPGISQVKARQRFGLPEHGRLALVAAGAWGVGDVRRTAADVLATGRALPVVLCGRNESLYRRMLGFPGHVLGWVDDMPTLMRAVDVVVENAGGLTCLESIASGLPTVTYRPLPGHGRASAAVLRGTGLTAYVDSVKRLGPALTLLLDGGGTAANLAAGAEMADVVSEAATRLPGGPPGHGRPG
ncbi:UDP-N-acetylglucosamine--LPS N-acetylglucosamine transferase [Polymorphospora sp. 2-325]|uniref:UDP-N-acetylglucosamine--LPS N-acetylglucosamine transferase n=2 Tax=Micromonosporaceae TaxID=28056 RepID=A0ABV5CJ68_9ACTN